MYRTLKSPLNVQVELTWECNNKCRHCYNAYRHEDEPLHTLSYEQLDTLVEMLDRWDVVRVIITGGEPLLFPDRVLYFAEKLRERGIGVYLNSTLGEFNKAIGNRLHELEIDAIMTSLVADIPEVHDYVTQREGSYEETRAGIQLAVDMGFRVIVNMVLTKWNFNRLWQTGELVGRMGAAKFGATRACAPAPLGKNFLPFMIDTEEVRRSLQVLYALQEKWGYDVDVIEHYPWCTIQDIDKYKYLTRRKCTAGITSCSVGADGNMKPCGHGSMKYGNIFEVGFQVPWLCMMDWRRQVYTASECKTCPYFEQCTGGCPVDEVTLGRDHHRTGPGDVIPPTPIHKEIGNMVGEFVYDEEAMFRKEPFGGTLCGPNSGVLFVGEQTFQMATELRREDFNKQLLVETFGVEEGEANAFLWQLHTRKLIKEVS